MFFFLFFFKASPLPPAPTSYWLLVGSLAGWVPRVQFGLGFDLFLRFVDPDLSHWIRAAIPCKTMVLSRP